MAEELGQLLVDFFSVSNLELIHISGVVFQLIAAQIRTFDSIHARDVALKGTNSKTEPLKYKNDKNTLLASEKLA